MINTAKYFHRAARSAFKMGIVGKRLINMVLMNGIAMLGAS
jgi:hypothetical protein